MIRFVFLNGPSSPGVQMTWKYDFRLEIIRPESRQWLWRKKWMDLRNF